MHLEDQFDEWQQNSLLNMKTSEDWQPVWLGLGLIAFLFGLVFLKFYLDRQKTL